MVIPPSGYQPSSGIEPIAQSYSPSSSMLFSESMLYGLRTMWWQEWLDEIEFDSHSGVNLLSESQYQDSEYYRDGIKWFDGMTIGQAEVMAESYDRNEYYSSLTQNVSFLSGKGVAMFGGILAGSLPDPLNYIPFLGLANRVVKSGRMLASFKTARNAFKADRIPGRPWTQVLTDITDPMIGAGIANIAIADKRSKFQEQHDYKMVLMDMAVAGGIGIGIAGAKSIRSKLAKVSAKAHADRIAMGMEQLEAGEGLNLAPHPHKGLNYQNSPDTTIPTQNGVIYSNAVVRVLDENYLNVDVLSGVSEVTDETIEVIQEGLSVSNAMGYKGLFIRDEVLGEIVDDLSPDVILAEIEGTEVHIERVPESGGIIISDVLTEVDGVSWEYVDTNNQWSYNETANVVAESIQDRIRESIGEFAEVSDVVKRSVDEIGEASSKITDTFRKVGERVTDAANCLIKNG
jgi:hypothetical protein